VARSDIHVVCGSHEAFRRRDLDAFLEHMDPEVEFTSLVLEVEGAYRGHDGARAWWDDILAVFPDWQPQVEDARQIGERVLLKVRAEGAGTGSGIDLDRVTDQLLVEGVAKFSKAFNQMIQAVGEKLGRVAQGT